TLNRHLDPIALALGADVERADLVDERLVGLFLCWCLCHVYTSIRPGRPRRFVNRSAHWRASALCWSVDPDTMILYPPSWLQPKMTTCSNPFSSKNAFKTARLTLS